MTYQTVTAEQSMDLPPLSSGIKWFKGSAGLSIAWKLDTESQPPTLTCTLFTRAPNDELSYVPPISGTTMIQLNLRSGTQLFQLKRQPLPDEVVPETGPVLPLQTQGLIYLGGLLAAPDDVPGNKGRDAPLFLHVHCRLNASSGFRTRIAKGTYGQFIDTMPSTRSVETVAEKLAENTAKPAQAASAGKQPIARKNKARSTSKRPH